MWTPMFVEHLNDPDGMWNVLDDPVEFAVGTPIDRSGNRPVAWLGLACPRQPFLT
jgi:hypothetical protein